MAQTTATIDEFVNGRMVLGIGVSHQVTSSDEPLHPIRIGGPDDAIGWPSPPVLPG